MVLVSKSKLGCALFKIKEIFKTNQKAFALLFIRCGAFFWDAPVALYDTCRELESDQDIDDRFSFVDDSQEENESEEALSNEYNPPGIESDDDEGGCSHWSKKNEFDVDRSTKACAASPEHIKPSKYIDIESQPYNW